MCAETRKAPLPRGLGLSTERSGKGGAVNSRPAQSALQFAERDVIKRGLNLGFRCRIQMLDLAIRSNAAAHRIDRKLSKFQITPGELICSLQLAQLNAVAGGGRRKDFACKLAVDRDVPKQRLVANCLVAQLAA